MRYVKFPIVSKEGITKVWYTSKEVSKIFHLSPFVLKRLTIELNIPHRAKRNGTTKYHMDELKRYFGRLL